jgi:hypothetical protein
MDPVLIEVLRFGTAILAGGLVAVIAQRLAFDHARRLQGEEMARRDASLRRALVGEIDENLRRLDPANEKAPVAMTHRSAWDQARGLAMDPADANVVAEAYAEGDTYNAHLTLRDARRAAGTLSGAMSHIQMTAPDIPALNAYVGFRAAYGRLVGAVPSIYEEQPRWYANRRPEPTDEWQPGAPS